MSAADFLLAPEVQKLLMVLFAEPGRPFSVGELTKKTRLETADIERVQQHLIESGMLLQHHAGNAEDSAVSANTAFVFYAELRRLALKSFAAAEPVRRMLLGKFKTSVVRAFILGEDAKGTVELLVVHGELVPDPAAMAAACQRLSASMGRHLNVHVISHYKYASLTPRDALGGRLAGPTPFEIIGQGDTKARLPAGREGLLEVARRRLAALRR